MTINTNSQLNAVSLVHTKNLTCVELTICVYRHLPIFLSSFSYVPDLLRWVDYLCLSSFTDLLVKFFVCTRLTGLSWLFVFIVIYQPFCQAFRMYQTYWVELAICVYRYLPIFLSSFSHVPDLLRWVGYLCLSSFTDLFVKFFVCTRLTALSWLFVFIVIYQPLCQVFRMYQIYWVELAICVYRHLPTFLSSFSYVPDLLGWVGYLCLSSFTDLLVKFFVCTRLTGLSWLFVFIVIYRPFCQVFRMYQTYWVEAVNDDKHK
jgi:DNA integrity scanning protein DisA with diadenylate cyclase activity